MKIKTLANKKKRKIDKAIGIRKPSQVTKDNGRIKQNNDTEIHKTWERKKKQKTTTTTIILEDIITLRFCC